MSNLKDYTDRDYKYVAVVDNNILKDLFNDLLEQVNPNYSLVILYKGNTYIISLFALSDHSENFSIIKYKNVASTEEKFESTQEFYNKLDNLFNNEKVIVLMEMAYEGDSVLSYPVTVNNYLNGYLVTRSSAEYMNNMPEYYKFQTFNKTFTLLTVFMIINLFIGIICAFNIVNVKDILFTCITLFSAILSLIILLFNYGYKTSIVNGLIESKKLLRFSKTYNFSDIDYIEDVIYFNIFKTSKIYKIYMKDKRIVKIKYFNSSASIEDDEKKEMIVYLREMFIENNVKIKEKEISLKLITVIYVLIYIISLVVL